MKVSEKHYLRVALDDPDGNWELVCGELRQKPSMTARHNDIMFYLGASLASQLDRREFPVRSNAGRARRSSENYFIPDVTVIPTAYVLPLLNRSNVLEAFSEPLPLVVEVWSPSTDRRDLDLKLQRYREHGHAEIWFIHPFQRTMTAWRRQPDGESTETLFRSGIIQPVALPGVTIDLDQLFD